MLLFGVGSIATGDLNFLSIPQVDLTSNDVSPTNSSSNHHGTLNPFSSSLDGGQSSTSMNVQGVSRGDELGPTASASSGQKEEPVKKRKQSQVALVLEEYMDFRKKQTQKFVEEMKEPKEATGVCEQLHIQSTYTFPSLPCVGQIAAWGFPPPWGDLSHRGGDPMCQGKLPLGAYFPGCFIPDNQISSKWMFFYSKI